MNIGLKIKKCREELGMSQSDLAEVLKINRANVGMWESFKNRPKLEDVVKLSKIFNVSTDYLLDAEDVDFKKQVQFIAQSDDEKELLSTFKKLSSIDKARVLVYAKTRLETQGEINDIKIRTGYKG